MLIQIRFRTMKRILKWALVVICAYIVLNIIYSGVGSVIRTYRNVDGFWSFMASLVVDGIITFIVTMGVIGVVLLGAWARKK